MLSGNGRHRRPRQAPALLVTAGVTGSAIALPLIGASAANAADGTTWDKVAECESGGSWSADNGNGYYGGLQLSQEDWEKYGGLAYAASADQASRSQQIAVAEKILADQGPGAWRTCALLSGLTKDSGAAKVDTGVADGSSGDADSSGTSGSSGSVDSSGASGSSHSSDPSGSSGGSNGPDGSGVSDPGPSDSSQEGPVSSGASETPSDSFRSGGTSVESPARHAGSGSPSSASGKSDNTAKSDTSAGGGSAAPDASPSTPAARDQDEWGNSGQYVGSSALVDTGSLGSGRHRGASAEEGAGQARTDAIGGRHASRGAADAPGATGGSYTVRSGDSLTSIADSLDVHGGWHALYAANKGTIGADPDRIVAGQSLDVPGENAQNQG
jgi:hypothetical protein